MGRVITEVCVDSAAGALAALDGGADRVELCVGLEIGGLTPSVGVQEWVNRTIASHVLIRPRAGDFCYRRDETLVIQRDIEAAFELGAAAVVVGALTTDGDVDAAAMRGFLRAADGRPVTFHRAFDMTRDPIAALETLVDLGVARVLTSGCRRSAAEGAELLGHLVRRAAGRLVVMPGGGITPANAAGIVRTSGAAEIHFSARVRVDSPMRHRNPEVAMGSASPPDGAEYTRWMTSARIVGQILEAIAAGGAGGGAGGAPAVV